ncbi:MAG: xanthine dehydrogenase accessory protein XdhC [Bacteriovorax sp.]|jgi:xanthine dehydrogenase accessory factor
MNEDFLRQLYKLREEGTICVVVTLISVTGSAPQEVGARIIVGDQGLLYGTIGGGKLETKAIQKARDLLTLDNNHEFVQWNLQKDVGMTCGGVTSLFFEKFLPRSDWKIVVFGAGHVGQELVRLLIRLDCDVVCVDPRAEWLNKLPEHFRLKKIQTDDMKSVLKTLSADTFITSVTMGHAFDLPILKEALTEFNFPYIGAIGSDSKARVLKADLLKHGVTENLIASLHCPIGEPFGNNHPAEIAVSIVAQLLTKRDGLKK